MCLERVVCLSIGQKKSTESTKIELNWIELTLKMVCQFLKWSLLTIWRFFWCHKKNEKIKKEREKKKEIKKNEAFDQIKNSTRKPMSLFFVFVEWFFFEVIFYHLPFGFLDAVFWREKKRERKGEKKDSALFDNSFISFFLSFDFSIQIAQLQKEKTRINKTSVGLNKNWKKLKLK